MELRASHMLGKGSSTKHAYPKLTVMILKCSIIGKASIEPTVQ